MATILCVDDDPSMGVALESTLERLGHQPHLARSVDAAMDLLQRTVVELIIADERMPGSTGLDLLARLKRDGPDVPVIMLTGFSSIEHAVLAIKSGAIDYLTKPVRHETLEFAVNHALELLHLRRENADLRAEASRHGHGRQIVGQSATLQQALDTVAAVAPTRATVLLEGESGTGKEMFARAVHDQSPRKDKPFITLNCAAMPEGLVESALFGHEKGAFTGATARSAGAFERAHTGTLLLDEISEMRLDLQSKLLRVIQEQKFERVGGQNSISVDVRLIATTNRDLRTYVAAGNFREDLYYRLAVMPIRTPPLRERLEDIPLLTRHFVRRAAQELGISEPALDPSAIAYLQTYHWPGNVRELGNVVERTVILSRDKVLTAQSFDMRLIPGAKGTGSQISGPHKIASVAIPTAAAAAPSDGGIPAALYNLDEVERVLIERALQATGGNRVKAAGLLGISERTLRNKLNDPNRKT